MDHVLVFPYPYVWFNEVARFQPVSKDFDTDYWGLYSKAIAQVLNDEKSPLAQGACLAIDPFSFHQLAAQNRRSNFCGLRTDQIVTGEPGPFLVPVTNHNFWISDRTYWNGCRPVLAVDRRLWLSSEPIVMGTLNVCPRLTQEVP